MTDIDAWIDGAKRPQRAVTVFARADLISQIDELQRQIDIATATNADDALSEFEAEYEQIATQFYESSLVVTVKGMTAPEQEALKSQAEADKVDSDEVLGYRILSASIVDPPMTADQVCRMRDAIGEAQLGRINLAFQQASHQLPPEPRP